MHLIDYMIIVLLGYNAFVGLRQGAVRMITGIVGIIIATTLSKTIYENSFEKISEIFPLFLSYPFVYYGCCFVVLVIITHGISQILHSIFKWSGMGLMNHFFGLVLGAFRGLILVLILILPLLLIKPNVALQSIIVYQSSPMIKPLLETLNRSGFITKLFNSITKKSLSLPGEALE